MKKSTSTEYYFINYSPDASGLLYYLQSKSERQLQLSMVNVCQAI